MQHLTIGLMAHVDCGKTTLAEALLFRTGEIRQLGRVDHGNSWLDTNTIERGRGITIFSHQASFPLSADKTAELLDTPGHVDFSAEMERTLQVLDYAVLVISGTDGVQSHTRTLWRLLTQYRIPVFLFVNKMDISERTPTALMHELQAKLSPSCVNFSAEPDAVYENAATCEETLMNSYLEHGEISDEQMQTAIARREIFPCCFGSALKTKGIGSFLRVLERYTAAPNYRKEFGARVFKISTDAKGGRLTYLKILGGTLRNRDELSYVSTDQTSYREKITSIRFYSGAKYRAADEAEAGEICAVTGLTAAYAGQGLGCIADAPDAVLEPVMRYRVLLPAEIAPSDALGHFRQLESEDPQLHVFWNAQLRRIYVQLMGTVQLEVLTQVISERFGYSVTFESGVVSYKETIAAVSEGVGHYEPLRHYAEVHLLLEPLPQGSGLQFETRCSEDVLDRNWQRLILTHLGEKQHLGVLTGSPITDMKLVLMSGKAHLKHTEGGDFRQATYRAIRHGLRSTESVLLEPYYDFELEIPAECVGRAMTDIQQRSGTFQPPEQYGEVAVLCGSAPVSELSDYHSEVISYTKGKGSLTLTVSGYRPCHNAEEAIARIGYNPDSDLENTADSVFCSHGAGYNVSWDMVHNFMHLPSVLVQRVTFEEELTAPLRHGGGCTDASDDELMEIYERTYGKIHAEPRKAFRRNPVAEVKYENIRLPEYTGPEYLLVDGYNIIFAWDELKALAKDNLDSARNRLMQILSNYQGYRGCEVILVFDAYKVKGHHREIEREGNISIVYTREAETADSYIERVSHDLSKHHRVRVATSDGLEQLIVLGNGARRVSAREFAHEIKLAEEAIREYLS
ncbi:MAG: TetM/TetW/TetO/TetS family tetracycline resistance ribosomal protection protein [Oscillospiraceae bacterium]|nr:TetM/TetW/TetO/TetS family tetracycline resistance ribosomal protection protein [Oscillospiraceae bacterium]